MFQGSTSAASYRFEAGVGNSVTRLPCVQDLHALMRAGFFFFFVLGVVTVGVLQFPFVPCMRLLQFCDRLPAGTKRRFVGSIISTAEVGQVRSACQPTSVVPCDSVCATGPMEIPGSDLCVWREPGLGAPLYIGDGLGPLHVQALLTGFNNSVGYGQTHR
jgi:hypothetical protein